MYADFSREDFSFGHDYMLILIRKLSVLAMTICQVFHLVFNKDFIILSTISLNFH